MSFKLGLCSISFRNLSPKQILENTKSVGLSCIEWGSDVHCPPEKVKEIAALQKEYDIQCSSYGTYFRLGVTPIGELENHIISTKILGTNILRLWCGNKNSEDYTDEEKSQLFAQCKEAAEIAKNNDVVICMECHNNTYTNKKEAALELMQVVNSKNFRMYWQPNQYRSEEENIEYAKLISPYTVNIHVFNWKGKEKYPLRLAKDIWKKYLNCFDDEKVLLLEFMPDDKVESLKTEAETLKEIAK